MTLDRAKKPRSLRPPQGIREMAEIVGSTIRKVKDAQRAESRDTLETLYDTGVRLLTSSMDTYIDVQKSVLDMAIREAEEEKIIGKPTAEAVQGVVAELTTSLELIRKGAEDFADAGKLLLDASRRPRK